MERHPSKARGGPRPEVERARLAAHEIKGLHLLEEIRGNQQKAAQERKDRVWQCGSVRGLWLQTAPPNLMSYRMAPSETSSHLTALACQETLLRGKQLVPVGFLGVLAYKEMVAWP